MSSWLCCSSTQSVSGTLAIINNQLSIKPAISKIKQPINSIEIWSDAFINFILVYSHKGGGGGVLLLTTQSANGLSMTCSSDYVPVKTQIGHGHKSMVICGCHVVCQVTFLQSVKGMRLFKGSCTRMLCNYAHVCIRGKVPHPAIIVSR